MGLCVSCDAADEGATTARVVLPSGELREYSPPATAALVLHQEADGGEGWFLCDADAMGLEGTAVSPVGAGDELRPGQIYFLLPAEMQRRRLTGEEVAALAVKASSALVKAAAAAAPSSPCRRGRSRRGAVAPLVFPLPEEEEYAAADEPMSPVAAKAAAAVQKRRVGSPRGGRASRFAPDPDLTAIPESE
ncbi:hypothetical protein PR202_ga13618 [Eleusine coracana subsp. coracana]|uniref:Uncharacterized protein n=1 Tax=Eleusine coracana subsp. coracana TaxID=191504 RepID=A0AAV5CF82_ELECO|nr:hypothetical protein QOZ80_3AG0214490 [Eleusine coracana subsp. coracana]GJM96755.1 hypothetical protein PR202_ga13618 [Eleusine coracana subsp. coracana]